MELPGAMSVDGRSINRMERGEPLRAEPANVGRPVASENGAGQALEVEARLGVVGVPSDPRDGVRGAPGGGALGKVDDVGRVEGVGDRLLHRLGKGARDLRECGLGHVTLVGLADGCEQRLAAVRAEGGANDVAQSRNARGGVEGVGAVGELDLVA